MEEPQLIYWDRASSDVPQWTSWTWSVRRLTAVCGGSGRPNTGRSGSMLSGRATVSLFQCSPLSLVEECRGLALIGRDLHSVATPARASKAPQRQEIPPNGSLWHLAYGIWLYGWFFMAQESWPSNSSDHSSTSRWRTMFFSPVTARSG